MKQRKRSHLLLTLTLGLSLCFGSLISLPSEELQAQTRIKRKRGRLGSRIKKNKTKRKIKVRKKTSSSGSVSELGQYKNSCQQLAMWKASEKKGKKTAQLNFKPYEQNPNLPLTPRTAPNKLRGAVLRMARQELGKVKGKVKAPTPVSVPGIPSFKHGWNRLLEYNVVAWGPNHTGWSSPQTFTKLLSYNQKHTTWCGIFALWAIKAAAGHVLSDYKPIYDKAAKSFAGISPVLAYVSSHTYRTPPGFTAKNLKNKYRRINWQSGYPSLSGKRLSPTFIPNVVNFKKKIPNIKPGDIGYVKQRTPTGVTYHHFIIERIYKQGGTRVYYTIEGNYFNGNSNQEVIRNVRCFKQRPGNQLGTDDHIDGWYNVDILANTNNTHTKTLGHQYKYW